MKTNKMKNNVPSIAVIGGGASGLTAAIAAARYAKQLKINVVVTVYESNSRVGKKILVTGNGRCNFTNDIMTVAHYHGEKELAQCVLNKYTNDDIKSFFCSMGLFSKSDAAGRVYPMSSQATAVLDVLRYEAESLGVIFNCETKITSLNKHNGKFLLNGEYTADRCIVATGGKAAPVHGSDGSGFHILREYGVKITDLFPALVPIVCSAFPKSLKGIRAQGKISIKCSGKLLSEDCGEIQYTEYGLSGIPAMQVSRFAALALADKKSEVYAVVDSCPYFTSEELKKELFSLIKNNPNLPCELLLAGIMPKKLGVSFLNDCSVNAQMQISKLHPNVVERIVKSVKAKKYIVSSVKGFSDAQVTCGGIAGEEIEYNTLELKKIHGAYVCGEIVNIDGDCGGYNLQWAWASGLLAGISAVRSFDSAAN